MSSRRKPSPVLTAIMSNITDEDREKTRKEMMNMLKTKISHEVIKEFFIDKMNWLDDTLTLCNDDFGYEITIHYYTSPCRRYVLTFDKNSNISDENGNGWNLHIDNSDMSSIGNVSVNYVEEIVQLIDIFKNY